MLIFIGISMFLVGVVAYIRAKRYKRIGPTPATIMDVCKKEIRDSNNHLCGKYYDITVKYLDNNLGQYQTAKIRKKCFSDVSDITIHGVSQDEINSYNKEEFYVGDQIDIFVDKKRNVKEYSNATSTSFSSCLIIVGLVMTIVTACIMWYQSNPSLFMSPEIKDKLLFLIFGGVFLLAALILSFNLIKKEKRFKDGSVEVVEVEVCDVYKEYSRTGSRGRYGFSYRPIYQFEYGGEIKRVRSDVSFGTRGLYPIGKKLKLKYNSDTDTLKIPGHYSYLLFIIPALIAGIFMLYQGFII